MAYDFDIAFQEKVAAFFLRDNDFGLRVDGLIEPEYFATEAMAVAISVQKIYWDKYHACPSLTTFVQLFKKLLGAKRVKLSDPVEFKNLLGRLHKVELKDRDFVADQVSEFARTKAIENATLELADALDQKKDLGKASQMMTSAFAVGATEQDTSVNFVEATDERLQKRKNRTAGGTGGGITTGIPDLDKFLLPWRGLGRKELIVFMGPPKSGKTMALIDIARGAAQAGHNVFYASCEVSEEIISDRLDANVSGVPMKQLVAREAEVKRAIDQWQPTAGKLIVQAFAHRTLKVSALLRILQRYKSQGIEFDLVVVDYAQIMAPESTQNDKRHELAQIIGDLRGVAHIMNCAMLTASQTNREGSKKAGRHVAEGTDAAEDYEQVRVADGFITINASDDDRNENEVVLYLAELRNAEDGIRLRFKQDLGCARFVTTFIGMESS